MNLEPGLVSYVIPYYEGARHIAETLQSALAQQAVGVEVVVVDDGSPQPCADVVQHADERLRIVRTQNYGVSGARNIGLSIARGEYVCFLDQDDLVAPSHAQQMVQMLEDDPALGAVYCSVRELVDGVVGPAEEYTRYPSALALFKTRMILSMGALVFRRRAIEGLGGFDLGLSNSGEDWDFCLRVARFVPMAYVREGLFTFRRHDAQASLRTQALAHGALRVLAKHRRFRGPGAYTLGEAWRARSGILGFWGEWCRQGLKADLGLNRRMVRWLAYLAWHPALIPHVFVPPIKGWLSRSKQPA